MENVTQFASLENATDVNYTDYQNDTQSYDHKAIDIEVVCFVVIGSVFCLLGIIGNGLVIWFGFFKMKKTVNVVWFLSLAIADFFFALVYPVHSIQYLLKKWSKFLCKIMALLLSLNSSVSVLQLMVISVDRCICVVFPVWCHNHRRPRLVFKIALIIWIISFALATPYILYADTLKRYDGTICILYIDYSFYIKKTVLGFVFFFLLPLIIIVSCYIVIIRHMRRKHIFTSCKSFKTIMAIIIAFFICWFPYYLISLFIIFRPIRIPFYVLYYGNMIGFILIIINSCINPILYVFIGQDFKVTYCGSFQATIEKAFVEDEEKEDRKNQEQNTALTRVHTKD
ncbi:chemerin-like receptor 1 [Anomaloglossus baeobatrachus]|uniref:chemerin-like receptor 1 n=1 Tax=Anomaloglossus baeobatrachus TaxID=238106 RepID=UPI003F500152